MCFHTYYLRYLGVTHYILYVSQYVQLFIIYILYVVVSGFIIFLGVIWILQETTEVRILRYIILFIGKYTRQFFRVEYSHWFPNQFLTTGWNIVLWQLSLKNNVNIFIFFANQNAGVMNSLFSVYGMTLEISDRSNWFLVTSFFLEWNNKIKSM
jgi:hypothetical protein